MALYEVHFTMSYTIGINNMTKNSLLSKLRVINHIFSFLLSNFAIQ